MFLDAVLSLRVNSSRPVAVLATLVARVCEIL